MAQICHTPFGTFECHPSPEALFTSYYQRLVAVAKGADLTVAGRGAAPVAEVVDAPVAERAGGLGGRPSAPAGRRLASVALTGGSTPKAFYRWVSQQGGQGADAADPHGLRRLIWTVSDERMVPMADQASNFGVAWRDWLGGLGIPDSGVLRWPTDLSPDAAAEAYAEAWDRLTGREGPRQPLYDLCTLGLGEDTHTASLFPGCPLLWDDGGADFAATEWPGRGWRLTVTPTGLAKCPEIIVLVTGASKVKALRAVLQEPIDLSARPAQILARHADRTTWLLDAEAARALE